MVFRNIPEISHPFTISTLSSDHDPVIFYSEEIAREDTTKTVYDYTTTNRKKFRSILDSLIQMNDNINSPEEIDSELQKFTKSIIKAREKTTKHRKITPYYEKIPDNLLCLIKYRNKIRKRWQSSRNITDRSLKYPDNEIKKQFTEYKNKRWNEKLSKFNTSDNSFLQTAKSFNKNKNQIPNIELDNINYITDQQKANILSETFQKAHILNQTNNNFHNRVEKTVSGHKSHSVTDCNKLLTNPTEIKSFINNLANKKSPGVDGIDDKLLKNLSKKAVVQLMYIINSIIKHQHWPMSWKQAMIIPIPKLGKTSDPNKFRPISLLPSFSILTEKIIAVRLEKLLTKTEMQDPNQFGFKKNTAPSIKFVGLSKKSLIISIN